MPKSSDAHGQSKAGDFVQSPAYERRRRGVTETRRWTVAKKKGGWRQFSNHYNGVPIIGGQPAVTKPDLRKCYKTYTTEFQYYEEFYHMEGESKVVDVTNQFQGTFSATIDSRNDRVEVSLDISGTVYNGEEYLSDVDSLVSFANVRTAPANRAMNVVLLLLGAQGTNLSGDETVSDITKDHHIIWNFSPTAVSVDFELDDIGSRFQQGTTSCTLSEEYTDEEFRELVQELRDFETASGKNGLDGAADGLHTVVIWNSGQDYRHFISLSNEYGPSTPLNYTIFTQASMAGQIEIPTPVVFHVEFGGSRPITGYTQAGFIAAYSHWIDSPGDEQSCRIEASRFYPNRPRDEAAGWTENETVLELLGVQSWCVVRRETYNNGSPTASVASFNAVLDLDDDGYLKADFDLGTVWTFDVGQRLLTYPNRTPTGTSPNCACT